MRASALLIPHFVLLAALAVGCDEKKQPPPAPPPGAGPAVNVAASSAPTGPAPKPDEPAGAAASETASTVVASAAPSGAPVAAATGPGATTGGATTGSTTPSASAAPTPSASTQLPKAFACGGEGMPKCPLQKWMAENMQPPMKAADPVKLAAALRQSAKLGPKAGYPGWAKFANDGADAVEKAKDVKAGKSSCTGCHTEYKQKYKLEDRDRAL